MSRDAVIAALFAKLQTIPGLVTTSRRLKHWSDVSSAEQPALFLTSGSQVPNQSSSGLPATWRIMVSLYLYAHSTDAAVVPSTVLNNLLDAIEVALAPSLPGQKQTLGGLCVHCWISGAVETDEGVLGDQAMAIIPLEILLA